MIYLKVLCYTLVRHFSKTVTNHYYYYIICKYSIFDASKELFIPFKDLYSLRIYSEYYLY